MKVALHAALRVALGVAFVYAGALKLGDPLAFSDSVASFRLLPGVLITPVALGLPIYELLLGLLLVVNRCTRPAALAVLLLCLAFTAALAAALARGITVDCGCFGRAAWATNPRFALARDLVLVVASWAVYQRAASLSARE